MKIARIYRTTARPNPNEAASGQRNQGVPSQYIGFLIKPSYRVKIAAIAINDLIAGTPYRTNRYRYGYGQAQRLIFTFVSINNNGI
jgi:hypothetical protein